MERGSFTRWRRLNGGDLPSGAPVEDGVRIYTFHQDGSTWVYELPTLPELKKCQNKKPKNKNASARRKPKPKLTRDGDSGPKAKPTSKGRSIRTQGSLSQ